MTGAPPGPRRPLARRPGPTRTIADVARVTDDDRRIMARQAEALATLATSAPGTDADRQEAIDAADADRARAGRPPLKTESEFHRKAVERGLVRG